MDIKGLIISEKNKMAKIIELKGLLTYVSPNEEIYKSLMSQEKARAISSDLDVEFGCMWGREVRENVNLERMLKEIMGGNTLVDLGCGFPHYLNIAVLAKELGAKGYIGVDKNMGNMGTKITANYVNLKADFPNGPLRGVGIGEKYSKEDKRTNIPEDSILVRIDMLDFISRLPSNSFNFTLNGIDTSILNTKEYTEAVIKEIIRATRKGIFSLGLNLDHESGVIGSLTSEAEKNGFKKIYEKKERSGLKSVILRK